MLCSVHVAVLHEKIQIAERPQCEVTVAAERDSRPLVGHRGHTARRELVEEPQHLAHEAQALPGVGLESVVQRVEDGGGDRFRAGAEVAVEQREHAVRTRSSEQPLPVERLEQQDADPVGGLVAQPGAGAAEQQLGLRPSVGSLFQSAARALGAQQASCAP